VVGWSNTISVRNASEIKPLLLLPVDPASVLTHNPAWYFAAKITRWICGEISTAVDLGG
jgi:hypothetical protein